MTDGENRWSRVVGFMTDGETRCPRSIVVNFVSDGETGAQG